MKKYIFIALFLLLLVSGSIIWSNKVEPKVSNELNKFYTADVKGVLLKSEIKYKLTSITLVEGNEQYLFSPITSEINGNNIFLSVASKGDSVIKPAFSDTLILIKKGQKYHYTFRKGE